MDADAKPAPARASPAGPEGERALDDQRGGGRVVRAEAVVDHQVTGAGVEVQLGAVDRAGQLLGAGRSSSATGSSATRCICSCTPAGQGPKYSAGTAENNRRAPSAPA